MLTLHAFKKLFSIPQLLFASLLGQFHLPFGERINMTILPVTATKYVI